MKVTREQREQLLALYAEAGRNRRLNVDLFHQAEELRESLGITPTPAFYDKAVGPWQSGLMTRLPDPLKWEMTRYMGRRTLRKIRQCGPLSGSREHVAALGMFRSTCDRLYGPYFEAEARAGELPPWTSAPLMTLSIRAHTLSTALFDCLGGRLGSAVCLLGSALPTPEVVLAMRELVTLLRGEPLVQ